MADVLAQRWTFSQPSPLGDVSSSWELSDQGLEVRSDAPLGAVAEALRWDEITEAATAVVDLPAAKGGPDMPRWMPGQIEWLLASRRDGGRAFMQRLPNTEVRDAIVAAARVRLGSRWVGERLALADLQRRFGVSRSGDGAKVALLIVSVLAVLFVFLVLLVVASAILLLPAAFALGGWWFRKGLVGLRDALHASNTPTANASSAAIGFVELTGRAVAERPVAAGASGRPSVWWDVGVDAWQRGSDGKGGRWRQVMARHGGERAALTVEDATGRMPVWLRGADLLLEEHVWEKGKDMLPAPGIALLAGSAFDWTGSARVRVRERRMEAGGPVYVLGTLDEAHRLTAGADGGVSRLARWLRSGEWRRSLVLALPSPLRAPVVVAVSYVEMLFALGHGGARATHVDDASPPALDPHAVVVWKGHAGRPLLVSDRRESEAIRHLRKRSFVYMVLGGAVLCWALYELIRLF